jgi:hypothetical protein
MVQQQSTVADIFRRAQSLRKEHSDWSLKQLSEQLVRDFSGGPFPPLHNLTIPEQDARAPEEDWTAGLPIVRRGIQLQDWNEVVAGIILSLEQTENYERQRGLKEVVMIGTTELSASTTRSRRASANGCRRVARLAERKGKKSA